MKDAIFPFKVKNKNTAVFTFLTEKQSRFHYYTMKDRLQSEEKRNTDKKGSFSFNIKFH